MVRKTHKIIARIKEYLGMDCYGYRIKCSCGKDITGFTKNEVEESFIKHKSNIKRPTNYVLNVTGRGENEIR